MSNVISFSPTVANAARNKAIKSKDIRTWTDKMFQDFNSDSGELEAINVDVIDCTSNSTIGSVNVGNDNISILMGFAADCETTAILKGEDVIVLGGNRAGRGGQGRLFVPMSQFEPFLKHCAALYESLVEQLPALRTQIQESSGQEADATSGDITSGGFLD